MSEVQYILTCTKKGCIAEFAPRKTHRLVSNLRGEAEHYVSQDLMIGSCHDCNTKVMAWLGIDELDEPRKYFAISPKKHGDWRKRVSDEPSRIQTKKPDIVSGSEKEFPYRMMKRIVE